MTDTPARVLILASYCGDDNPDCTEERPCDECLGMCNVALAEGKMQVLGGLDYLADGGAEGEVARLSVENGNLRSVLKRCARILRLYDDLDEAEEIERLLR